MSENRPALLDLSRTDFVDFDRIPFPALLLLGGRTWYLPCLAEAAMVVDRAVAATIDLIMVLCWQTKWQVRSLRAKKMIRQYVRI